MDDSRSRDITIPQRDGYFPIDNSRPSTPDPVAASTISVPPPVALPQPVVGYPQQPMQPEFNPQVIAVESQPIVTPTEPINEAVFAPTPAPVVVLPPVAIAPATPVIEPMAPVLEVTPEPTVVTAPAPTSVLPIEPAPAVAIAAPLVEQPVISLPPPPPPPPVEIPAPLAPASPEFTVPVTVIKQEQPPLQDALDNNNPVVIPVSPLPPSARAMEFIATPTVPAAQPVQQPEIAPRPVQAPAPAPSTLEQTFTRPPEPVSRPVSVSPVAGYFQSIAGGTSAIPAAVASHASNGFARFKKPLIIAGISLLLVATGIYATTTLIANNNTRLAIQAEQDKEPATEAPGVVPVEQEEQPAEEELPVIVPGPEKEEEVQPTTPVITPSVANTSANDAEIAKQPRKISIPTLGIAASIENIGLTPNGAIGAPSSIWNAGWYTASAQPGTDGAVFIDGHASESRNGLFGDLDKARVGDTITVLRNDGKEVSYWIAKVSIVDRRSVDVAQTLKPYGNAKRGLNIMSCIGTWVESEKTLTHRVLVYAIER